jgi:hypothetical protein
MSRRAPSVVSSATFWPFFAVGMRNQSCGASSAWSSSICPLSWFSFWIWRFSTLLTKSRLAGLPGTVGCVCVGNGTFTATSLRMYVPDTDSCGRYPAHAFQVSSFAWRSRACAALRSRFRSAASRSASSSDSVPPGGGVAADGGAGGAAGAGGGVGVLPCACDTASASATAASVFMLPPVPR